MSESKAQTKKTIIFEKVFSADEGIVVSRSSRLYILEHRIKVNVKEKEEIKLLAAGRNSMTLIMLCEKLKDQYIVETQASVRTGWSVITPLEDDKQ